MKEINQGLGQIAGMSDPKQSQDSDSLTGWTLVDREGTPEEDGSNPQPEDEEGITENISGEDETVEEVNDESGSKMEEEQEEEPLSDELLNMGQMVQEIKGESIKGETADLESLASTDISVLDEEKKLIEEETDLSLKSTSLPDDLPTIKPDTQYIHTPAEDLNSRLNIVVMLTIACVIGLGLGHFLGVLVLSMSGGAKGWSSRSVWQESLNSAQLIEALNLENENLDAEIIRLQKENIAPIKIRGKDGKQARALREEINHLITDNEELRLSLAKIQYAELPDGEPAVFEEIIRKNYELRVAVNKLSHLVPSLEELKNSANTLEIESQELKSQIGKLRYEQPMPKELNAVAREVEKLKETVVEASHKKKVPSNLPNAKSYISYMTQVLSAINSWHEFTEGSIPEKIEMASDVFSDIAPGNVKISPTIQSKMKTVRSKFEDLKTSLSNKWQKVKTLSHPQNIAAAGKETLNKMNRVIVNVVNKMKEIGQNSILKRGKVTVDKTVNTLADHFSALDAQLDRTWKDLEAEVDGGKDEDSTVPSEENSDFPMPEVFDDATEKEFPNEEQEILNDLTEEEENAEASEDMETDPSITSPKEEIGDKQEKKKKSDEKKVKEKKNKHDKEDRKEGKKYKRTKGNEKDEKKEKRESQKKEREVKQNIKKEDKDENREERQQEKENKNNKRWHENKSKHFDRSNKKDKDLTEAEENHKYYKGQYNKYNKKSRDYDDDDDEDDDNDDNSRRHHKRYGDKNDERRQRTGKYVKHDDDDDDDNDYSDNHKDGRRRNIHKDDDDEEDYDDGDHKRKGIMRHWEQPSKKHHRREYSGPKKAFIRRRGKNQTKHPDNDWSENRASGRETIRKENEKADWVFERAKIRNDRRNSDQLADWQFDRARARKDNRYSNEEQTKRGGHKNKYEKQKPRKRYVRFDDDDDEDDFNHYSERDYSDRHKKNKGRRDWVIPNVHAGGGKAFYR